MLIGILGCWVFKGKKNIGLLVWLMLPKKSSRFFLSSERIERQSNLVKIVTRPKLSLIKVLTKH